MLEVAGRVAPAAQAVRYPLSVVLTTVMFATTTLAVVGIPAMPVTCTVIGSEDGFNGLPELLHWPDTLLATSEPPIEVGDLVSHILTGELGVSRSPVEEKYPFMSTMTLVGALAEL